MPISSNAVDAPRPGDRPHFIRSRGAIALAVLCLVSAILIAYHNSFSGPFVFDDGPAIPGNPTVRQLSHLGDVLSPPRENGQTVGGRPLVNLSLAVNYAIGGTAVRGYHVFNLTVHILGALVLFGIARRTLLQPTLRDRFGSAATPLALAVALLWAVHPLLTESVTYVIQRTESLMGLFYLVTLYGFIRGAAEKGFARQAWLGLSITSCLAGMATKEVMVSAPVIVLLYDRTFVAGSWRAAWSKRKYFYAGLGLTWVLLIWLVLGAENRGGTAGLGLGDSIWTYALTQTRAITLYLRLAWWPQPLVFDYGTEAIVNLADALPFAVLITAALGGVVMSWRRRPVVAFLGVWFFAILAPSSSFVPIPVQPMAEHRMYLPLAAIVALVVVSVYSAWRRGCWFVFATAVLALVAGTVKRNEDFRSATSLWADTVAKRPANARAQCYLADALAAEGRFDEALARYDEAMRLDRPALARGDRSIHTDLLVNSGNVLRTLGRNDEAAQRYLDALRLDAGLVAARFNLGAVYLQTNRLPEAIGQFTRVLQLDPHYAAAHTSLGSALLLAGQSAEALSHYEVALRLDPSAKAQRDLGTALLYLKRWPEAEIHLADAVRLAPDSSQAHEFLGSALVAQGRKADAIAHYQRALQLDPGNGRVRRALESLAPSSHESR